MASSVLESHAHRLAVWKILLRNAKDETSAWRFSVMGENRINAHLSLSFTLIKWSSSRDHVVVEITGELGQQWLSCCHVTCLFRLFRKTYDMLRAIFCKMVASISSGLLVTYLESRAWEPHSAGRLRHFLAGHTQEVCSWISLCPVVSHFLQDTCRHKRVFLASTKSLQKHIQLHTADCV